ncbi:MULTISPECIES: hypothetical protein [Niastella]|uniref:Autotransporter domain-containing protein n=1 Tax=Niastella soli TaxID=2821487 RepID=A0ABS3YSC9_9BACT|nr:hypothetical protein [Niastella soli]MBO9200790.1 hypothetical protein [Niastella soli]
MSSCLITANANAQSDTSKFERIINFPHSFLGSINKRTANLEDKLTINTEKYLRRMAKQENRLKRKLSKVDSNAAKNLFPGDPADRYEALAQKFKADTALVKRGFTGEYLPYLDSMKTSLAFLEKNPQLTNSSKILPSDVKKSLSQVQQLQAKIESADKLKQYVQQRKAQLKASLSNYPGLPGKVTAAYKNYSKECFYYTQQLKEYKTILLDPDQAMQKAFTVLNKVPAFSRFMQKNSMLASMFNLPGSGGEVDPTLVVTGLQPRSQVMDQVQTQMGTTGPNAGAMVQQNVQSAQGQINALRDKLNSVGGGKGDLEMPDFKPNAQKTKSFLKRLEYGTNIQSAQANTFFPTTTDLALSVGYKISDKNIIGVGASYKVGWGKDVRHIAITQQGMGLRSFLDVKLKGSFYASGGLEYNYQPIALSDTLTSSTGGGMIGNGKGEPAAWTKSGLIGLTKIVSLKSKTFKKTRLQLLWDFLSYQQRPQTAAFKFRVGYSF